MGPKLHAVPGSHGRRAHAKCLCSLWCARRTLRTTGEQTTKADESDATYAKQIGSLRFRFEARLASLDRRNTCLRRRPLHRSPSARRLRDGAVSQDRVSQKRKTAIFRLVPHCSAVVKILVDASTLVEKD